MIASFILIKLFFHHFSIKSQIKKLLNKNSKFPIPATLTLPEFQNSLFLRHNVYWKNASSPSIEEIVNLKNAFSWAERLLSFCSVPKNLTVFMKICKFKREKKTPNRPLSKKLLYSLWTICGRTFILQQQQNLASTSWAKIVHVYE